MKLSVLMALVMLASLPALAQDQSSCKAFFQVLRADAGTPGLRTGLDSAQKKWWDAEGQKKYPGLCLNGAVASGDKPRFLVIWSRPKTIGQTSPAPADVYGQSATALQTAAHAEPIYQSRWNLAQVTVINVLGDGSLLLPPIYFETEDRVSNLFAPDNARIFKAAVKYLWYERVFLANPN